MSRILGLTLGLGVILGPMAAGLALALGRALQDGALGQVLDWEGLGPSLWLSLTSGAMSTLMATVLALLIVGALAGTTGFSWLRRFLSPLLALPHAAAALGLAFLIAPSGWIARLLSPWATGWTVPPDLMILNDPWGIGLTLGLVAKETPFLVLMALAAWPQTDAARRLALASSLGYGRIAGFALGVMPDLLRQLRLPVHAVLAYGLTNVDMAMVLGPGLPRPLAVQVLHWAQAPGLDALPRAAAGAWILLIVTGLAILACEGLARAMAPAWRGLAAGGRRGRGLDAPLRALARVAAWAMTLGLLAGLGGLALWSVAGLWPFPEDLPSELSLLVWDRAGEALMRASGWTVLLGAASVLIALALALALLQAPVGWRPWVIYLPLLIPQVTLVPGLAQVFLALGLDGALAPVAVILGHLTFVLPYVLLSLSDPWRAWDPRVGQVAASLGASPGRIFWHLRLPMLLPALLTAGAVGFAVSVGQYLPTLILSGGRIPTLTTEALALASGGNRRLTGAFAVVQMALPAVGFLLALVLPRLVFARRRAMLVP